MIVMETVRHRHIATTHETDVVLLTDCKRENSTFKLPPIFSVVYELRLGKGRTIAQGLFKRSKLACFRLGTLEKF